MASKRRCRMMICSRSTRRTISERFNQCRQVWQVLDQLFDGCLELHLPDHRGSGVKYRAGRYRSRSPSAAEACDGQQHSQFRSQDGRSRVSGNPSVDPRDEHCQSAVGSASDSRRTGQTGYRYWAYQCSPVQDAEAGLRRRDGRHLSAIMRTASPPWTCSWCRLSRFGCCMCS